MKLPCENCIKADVCKVREEGHNWIKSLALSKNYQELEKNNIKVWVACKSFCKGSEK